MRENKLTCDRYDFLNILSVKGRKAMNEHATLTVKGHISIDSDEYVLHSSAGETVEFTAKSPDGSQRIFKGLVSGIDIHTENEMRTLTVTVTSKSALMDLERETRTFQDKNMTYAQVTQRMEQKHGEFGFMWPIHGGQPIGSMTVQYQETDWHYAKRLAGRLGTVVVPDYLLGTPYISIGMTKRPAKPGIEAIAYSLQKDVRQFREKKAMSPFSERDAICYSVKSREIFDLCDPIPFLGLSLYVYAIDTWYEGDELLHLYTLKEKSGFHTQKRMNEDLIGVSLRGHVIEIKDDTVRVKVNDDVSQTVHKWFPYATPFSQPDGYGWYFMPEIGDEIRLQFPSEQEHDAYVSSAVHITHGNRMDPKIKFIRTVYGQIIQFDPQKIWIDDGAGSSVTLHKSSGITIETDKVVDINAQSNISVSAGGKITLDGGSSVSMFKGSSMINVQGTIDISSEHTRIQ